MMQSQVKRGRPKGTGIDDSDRIQRLIELLRVHPELKPTTAIRVMGFSDPSAIRRLRDKYKASIAVSRNLATMDTEFDTAQPMLAMPGDGNGTTRVVRHSR